MAIDEFKLLREYHLQVAWSKCSTQGFQSSHWCMLKRLVLRRHAVSFTDNCPPSPTSGLMKLISD